MNTQSIPAHPVPLTAELAATMEQMHIKKHDVAIVLLHWFNASVWLVELMTGLALIVGSGLSRHAAVVPHYDCRRLGVSRKRSARSRRTAGLCWIIVFLVYGVFGYRNYLRNAGADQMKSGWIKMTSTGCGSASC